MITFLLISFFITNVFLYVVLQAKSLMWHLYKAIVLINCMLTIIVIANKYQVWGIVQ